MIRSPGRPGCVILRPAMSERARNSQSPVVSGEGIVAFLSGAESYPHRPGSVQIVQTHISYVAVAGDLVYKIKKPVDFGFVDFTMLDQRRHFCHREVELNRRLCPDIYLGVVPIVNCDGALALGTREEDANVVEYAVKMRRLDERHFLSVRLEQGGVDTRDVDRIVGRLVPFYRDQGPTSDIRKAGRPDEVDRIVLGNLDACAEYVGSFLSSASYESLRHFARQFVSTRWKLLDDRVDGHRIKDCHGDLRPEHIHICPDGVCIYDCIEFNDRFRFIDVASDIAFLAMELDHAGRVDLHRYFVDAMAEQLGDEELKDLLAFYMSYRAAVRGKVNSLRAVEAEAEDDRCDPYRTAARAYFQQALRYALFGLRPTVVAVMGRVGAGKTTLAAALAEETGAEVFASDPVRKELAGLPLFERPSAGVRKRLYTTAMTEKTYARLNGLAATELAAGRCVILDATFGRTCYRKELIETVERLGAGCMFIEACAPEEEVESRLRRRDDADEVISDARVEDLQVLRRRYEPPEELGETLLVRIDTTRPVETVIDAAFDGLIRRNP